MDHPVILVRDWTQTEAALLAARASGTAPVLLTPEDAASFYGAGYLGALQERAREEFPDVAFTLIVDCGDAPGYALACLRAGVRTLLRRLQQGGVVGILPDQQPKAGDGEFAPFFGKPALTMTLLGRLAARSGAQVLMAWCERVPGSSPPRFALHVQAAPDGIAARDPVQAVGALNAAVEAIARRDPAQYQWTYKRYTLRPPGSGEANPYHDLY
jgi:hypothetical protein